MCTRKVKKFYQSQIYRIISNNIIKSKNILTKTMGVKTNKKKTRKIHQNFKKHR